MASKWESLVQLKLFLFISISYLRSLCLELSSIFKSSYSDQNLTLKGDESLVCGFEVSSSCSPCATVSSYVKDEV